MGSCDPTLASFFVYGTLLSGLRNHAVIARHGPLHIAPARVRGRLFDTGLGYPGMHLSPPADWVQGELITLADPGVLPAALADLDDLEEFHGEGDPRNAYVRRIVQVRGADGSDHAAWTYVFVRTDLRLAPIPGGCWRQWDAR